MLSGCLVTDDVAIFSTQAIWASLIRPTEVPGDVIVYAGPVRTGPRKITNTLGQRLTEGKIRYPPALQRKGQESQVLREDGKESTGE